MITEKNNVFYCDCGFSWRRGMSGSHYCEDRLRAKLAESQREFRAADATIHNLELKLTDMAVQLANAESKCRELAAENAGLKNPDNWLSQSDYGYEASEVATQNGATEDESLRAGMVAIINRIETPATDSFLAEVRAQGVDMAMEHMQSSGSLTFGDCYISLNEFAAQLRKGAAL
ncbi:hypothetical protein R4T09_08155 [Citrobacter freundii]|uniref:hypothetical protein n=1 Tax=Citrobacter freundii TaxID=546 RepID=UPI0024E14730|nr:hypothetical protein [Citrobacter freundii]WOR51523.1 hypothetical protein R4T09_08155 [Citrobacter freundii]